MKKLLTLLLLTGASTVVAMENHSMHIGFEPVSSIINNETIKNIKEIRTDLALIKRMKSVLLNQSQNTPDLVAINMFKCYCADLIESANQLGPQESHAAVCETRKIYNSVKNWHGIDIGDMHTTFIPPQNNN